MNIYRATNIQLKDYSSLIWSFGLRSDTSNMASLTIVPVHQSGMCSHTVIPHHHGPGLPLHACLDIGREGNMVIKELQKIVAFLLLEADNVSGELWVDIQGLLTGCWVSSNQRMDGAEEMSVTSLHIDACFRDHHLRYWVSADGATSVASSSRLFVT